MTFLFSRLRCGRFVVLLSFFSILSACSIADIRPMSPSRLNSNSSASQNRRAEPSVVAERDALLAAARPKPHRPAIRRLNAKDYTLIGSFGTGDSSYVRALFADETSMWVGTTEGVLEVSAQTGTPINTFTMKDGLKSPYIFTINKSPKGAYWFGTNNGGLTLFDRKTWQTYLPTDGLADFWVYGIDFAADGSAWIATWDGVSHFKDDSFTNYNTADGLADRWVYALSIDAAGDVWFGTESGVSRRSRDGHWRSWRHEDGLGAPNTNHLPPSENTGFGTSTAPPKEGYGHGHDLSVVDASGGETYNPNYVFSMAIDAQGDRWFGTWGGGVSRFDGTTWTNYTQKEGLAGNIVYDVTVDPFDGALWFGTNHGVSRFDGQHWLSLGPKEGLTNEHVYAVVIDAQRRLWLGEKGGVDVFSIVSAGPPASHP